MESSKVWHLGFHPHQHPLSLIVAFCRKQHAARELDSDQLPSGECEIPTGTGSGITKDGRIRSLKIKTEYPRVIKNFWVPMQSPGPEQISLGPGKGKPPGSY
ncbi:hypothetical protein F2Q69_00029267 [Brassica cretica]|uniref:Uncharacterized protein n=1 Tax=Brassica cretica TaxID=69181 RepID=A0A8S9RWA9_BRACR|nr:hypothetical protein F2Q69_00029263 [Brassica cretica]KAF3584753.1 hypothetical protein F2Q69_00029267 [Brassica cretica]